MTTASPPESGSRASGAAGDAQERPSPRVSAAENWDRLAQLDAMWAVLSDATKFGGKWDRREFFATGEGILTRLEAIERAGARIRYGVAVDFGCGLGRVSQWLAKRFSRVVGVDISPRMLELAEHYNSEPAPITFVLGNEENIPLATSSADFVYSFIALQHVPRPLQERYLREFCRIARPGGHLGFQVPSHPLDGGSADFSFRLMTGTGPATVEMNAFPRAEVEALLQGCGCRVVAVLDDDSCGTGMRSHFYVAQKPA
jgi:ubiquinone/menaquinone biosynthesis C-methylase UbiE